MSQLFTQAPKAILSLCLALGFDWLGANKVPYSDSSSIHRGE